MDKAAFFFTDWESNRTVLQMFCTWHFPGLLWGWKESYREGGRLSRSLTSSTVQHWAFSSLVSGWVSHDTGVVLQNEYSIICQTGGLNEYEKWSARGWQSACSRPCSTQSVQGCCSGVVQEGNAWRIRYVEQLLLAWSWRMPGDMKSFKPRISPYMKYFFTPHV